MAESILAAGKADIIGMGRASLADPDFPNKAKAGDLESIRPCVGCCQGCQGSLGEGVSLHCLVNPSLGAEGESDYSKVANPKSVLVVGGGPLRGFENLYFLSHLKLTAHPNIRVCLSTFPQLL